MFHKKKKGFLNNQRGSQDNQISKVVSKISNMFNIANKNRKYMNEKTRRAFVNSHVMGRLQYNMPLIAAGTQTQRDRVVKVINRAARFIRDDYCFRESISSIMRSVNWKMPNDIIDESSAKFIQKILYAEEPIDIFRQIKMPRTRACVNPVMDKPAKSVRRANTIIHKSLFNYNRIPPEIRHENPNKFKQKLKKTKLHFIYITAKR